MPVEEFTDQDNVPANPTSLQQVVEQANGYSKIPFLGGFSGELKMIAGAYDAAYHRGWLLCDGSAVSRTTYACLFAMIGTTFGAGDGSTTFNLPDMRDRVPGGKGTTFSALGTVYGSNADLSIAHTHTVPDHAHTLSAHTHDHDHTHETDINHTHTTGSSSNKNIPAGSGDQAANDSHTHTVNSGGGNKTSGQPDQNTTTGPSTDATDNETGVVSGAMSANSTKSPIQATLALNFIIKT